MWLVRKLWFQILAVLIVCVSLYDTYLIVLFSHSIRHQEKNPIGCWLIDVAAGDVGVFVRAKLAGTLIVMTTLVMMRRCRSPRTVPVTTSVAAYQVGLFTYLTFA
jgi:hypothetical protein